MSDTDTDLIFKGHTPGSISCADFVRAVRKHAVLEKKSRDDEYIADYAMSCFTDDAFYWSEKLSKEVQGDWSLLRRALVEEYGSSDRGLTPAVSSLPSAMIPVPAAAPPPAQPTSTTTLTPALPQTIRGLIKVLGPNLTGYLSKHVQNTPGSAFKGVCLATRNISDACVLSGTTTTGGLQFTFEDLDPLFLHLGTHLGVVWQALNPLSQDLGDGHGLLTVVNIQGSIASSKAHTIWEGPVSWLTWVRSLDNTLTPKLQGMLDAGILISDPYITIHSRADAYQRVTSWEKARFVFEPI